MKDRIEARAVSNRRSLSQEVISLLILAFEELEKGQTPKAEGSPSPD
jgi:hypothetical protein